MSDTLSSLHELVGSTLVEMIKSGEVDHRVLKEAREFLKDNGITNNEVDDPNINKLQSEPIVMEIPEEFIKHG